MIAVKYFGILLFLILVILSSGCIDNSDDSANVTMLNKSANGTYSVEDISFKCPDNWGVDMIKESENITIAASQIHESNDTEIKKIGPFKLKGFVTNLSFANPQFQVSVTPNHGIPGQEAINQVKNENMAIGNKISTKKIVIDSQNAIMDVIISNDTEDPIRFEYIYFFKNEKTYLITFSAAEKDFDRAKADFDMILNSFKIQ